MKKSLQIFLAFILILFLSYFAFLDVSKTIKDDLISKATKLYQHEKISGVHVELEGEGISTARVLELTGTVKSEEQKQKAETLAHNIEGVLNVHSKLKINRPTYTANPIRTSESKIPNQETKVKTIIKVEEEQNSSMVQAKTSNKPIAIPVVAVKQKEVKTQVPTVPQQTTTVAQATLPEKDMVQTVAELNVSIPTAVVRKIILPTVPTAVKSTVKIPVPIKVTTIPTAVKAQDAIVPEEKKKNIKTTTEGVE